MIRKDFLLKLKKQSGEVKQEMEDNNTIEDDNLVLRANRPIRDKDIAKLPEDNLENFVDRILFDKKSNKLMFSSNYKKEIEMLRRSHGKMTHLLKFKEKKVKGKKPENIQKEREKKEIISQAKIDIDSEKKKKNDNITQKEKDNEEFFKEIVIEKHNQVSPEQKYRKDRITKIYSSIKKKLDKVELPQVKLEHQDVYSRLYHNAVLTNAMMLQKLKKQYSTGNLALNRESLSTLQRNYSVKNIIESNVGKEFTMKVTQDQIMKCFSKNSGGPLIRFYDKKPEVHPLQKPKPQEDHVHNHIQILKQTVVNNGNTLLHDAVLSQKAALINYLLDKGLDINGQNEDGNTPLHLSCQVDNSLGCKKEIINLLIEKGADFTIRNKNNQLAMDLAEEDTKKHLGNGIKQQQIKRRESLIRSK